MTSVLKLFCPLRTRRHYRLEKEFPRVDKKFRNGRTEEGVLTSRICPAFLFLFAPTLARRAAQYNSTPSRRVLYHSWSMLGPRVTLGRQPIILRRKRLIIVSLFLLPFLATLVPSTAFADVIYLKNGRKIVGQVTQEEEIGRASCRERVSSVV